MRAVWTATVALVLTACAGAQYSPPQGVGRSSPPREWQTGTSKLQGYLGAAFYDLSTDGGSKLNLDDEDTTLPTIGGGGQWKLGGEDVDLGVEGLLSFAWRSNISAFVSTGSGAAIAVDVDLLVFDLYGGPFVSLFASDNIRVYAGAGPLLQWARYDQDGPTSDSSGDTSGFGFGYYARTGIEFAVSQDMMIGTGVRWTDSTIDLGSGLGDLDLQSLDVVFTVTKGF